MMRHVRGFTLIELLIALALAAGVTVASTLLARSALDYERRHAERWADRTGLRDARVLLDHYWALRLKDKFLFGPPSLLLYLDESDARLFVGFACEERQEDRFDLAYYRWAATDQETIRVQDGGVWPPGARQTLLSGLTSCAFSFLQPPPPTAEASGRWVHKWVGRSKPNAVRLDLDGPHGALPPIIVEAPAR
jgi:prepilin-type N-terminal cleavage/methylation domain-containing protein